MASEGVAPKARAKRDWIHMPEAAAAVPLLHGTIHHVIHPCILYTHVMDIMIHEVKSSRKLVLRVKKYSLEVATAKLKPSSKTAS